MKTLVHGVWLSAAFALGACGQEPRAGSPDGMVGADGGVMADAESTPDAATAASNTPGKYVHRIPGDGVMREFIVYVPELARGQTRAPLVVMIHGSSQLGEQFFEDTTWRQLADLEGMLVAYPTGAEYCYHEDDNGDGDITDPGERRVGTKWASGHLGDPGMLPLCTAAEVAALTPAQQARVDHPLQDDLAFFGALFDFVGATYSIDPRRIYTTGFSNGGQMSTRLAVEMSDRVAAAASSGGNMGITPAVAPRPMTFVLSIGEIDEKFTVPNGVAALPMDDTLVTSFPQFALRHIHAFSLANTQVHDELTLGGRRVSRFTYSTSTVGAQNRYILAIMGNTAHVYPDFMPRTLWTIFEPLTLP